MSEQTQNQTHTDVALDCIQVKDSGYQQIALEKEQESNYTKFLGKFLRSDFKNLALEIELNLEKIQTLKLRALNILNLIFSDTKIQKFHIAITLSHSTLDKLARELVLMYESIYENIKLELSDQNQYFFSSELKLINLYALKEFLPSLVLDFSEFLLRNFKAKDTEIYSELEKQIFDDANFNTENQSFNAQKYRLRAFYYRRLDEKQKANHELAQFYQQYQHKDPQDYKLKKIGLKSIYPKSKFLDSIGHFYSEIKDIQAEAHLRSGVSESTCFHYKCSDCCTYDFPTVSLVEFLHIKDFLTENKIDTKNYKDKASAIQADHQKIFNRKLEIVDQLRAGKKADNPNDYTASCPFLADDYSCSIHEARPLACRTFGVSTIDNSSVQACSYYLTQYRMASGIRRERDVFDSITATAVLGEANNFHAKNSKEFKDYNQPVATLAAWIDRLL